MGKIDIVVDYDVYTRVELPDDRQWEDVKSVAVKWRTAYFTFKDGEEWDADLVSGIYGDEGFKSPNRLRLFKCTNDEVGDDDDDDDDDDDFDDDDDDIPSCDGELLYDGANDYEVEDESSGEA